MVVQGTTREEQDIQEALSPQVNYYDWEHTSAACIAPVPEHPAYRANFADYVRNRSSYFNSDETAKARMSFYMPRFQARISSDLAVMNKISFPKFITHLCEIGLITFQIDYHDEYQVVRANRSDMALYLNCEHARDLYMQLDKMTINLYSGNGSKMSGATHFTPTVPEWLKNAIGDIAVYLNMTMTDMIFLCWCIGMKHSVERVKDSELLTGDINRVLEVFEFQLGAYSRFIVNTGNDLRETDKQYKSGKNTL